MKRFTFRLQKVLEIREKREQQQKLALARASGDYQKELRKQQAITENERAFREKIKQSMKAHILSLRWLDYYGWQSKRIENDLKKQIEQKRQVMEKELAHYNRLRQEKRAVEILKEKAWKIYQEASFKEEQQILDEISQHISNKNIKFSDKQREEEGGERL